MKDHLNRSNVTLDTVRHSGDVVFITVCWFEVAIAIFVTINGRAIFQRRLINVCIGNLKHRAAVLALHPFTCAFTGYSVTFFTLKTPYDDRHGPLRLKIQADYPSLDPMMTKVTGQNTFFLLQPPGPRDPVMNSVVY